MCMAKARTRTFSAFISSTKLFISNTKRIRLQRQKYSSLAQNAFIASNKPVRLQCDPYFEMSSRKYLVASDERVRLQCELMFVGE